MDRRVELYHFPPSLCSQKVRLALTEKGVPWESRLVNIGPPMENYEAWYARLNPKLVVPTLVHGDEVVTDSARIVRYVDSAFAGPPLVPDDAADDVEALIALQDGLRIREIVYAPRGGLLGWLSKGSFEKRHAVLERQRDAHPDLAEIYQARLDDVSAWKETSHDAAQVAAEIGRVRAAIEELARRLDAHRFAASDDYTLADVVWTVILARCVFMGYRQWWTGDLSAVASYYERMRARPSFDQADVWERVKPLTMLPIIGSVLWQRLTRRGLHGSE